MIAELRYALRALLASRPYSAAVVLTMALGIGATASIFTVVNAVVLRALPYPDSHRIVSLSMAQNGTDQGVVPDSWFLEWQSGTRAFDALAVTEPTTGALTTAGEATMVRGRAVTEQFFRVMGVSPSLGRLFAEGDFASEEGGPVVLGYALWRDALGSASSLAGRTITLSGRTRDVIGVMPAGFAPDNAQYWEPTTAQPPEVSALGFSMHYYYVIGRLKAAARPDDIRAELTMLARRSQEKLPAVHRDTSGAATVLTLHDRLFGSARRSVWLLSFAVGFLLLIACANVANLSLARGATRRQEFAVRIALGASGWRLARQALTESVMLAMLGGALGLTIPLWTLPLFLQYRPDSLANITALPVDGTVIMFTALAATLTGLAFGLFPAVASVNTEPITTLHATSARMTGSARQHRVRNTLIVTQIAVALMLVTGAGLLTRSLAKVLSVDPGFHPGNTLIASIPLASARYADGPAAMTFFTALTERVRAMPGVDAAAYSAGTYPLRSFNISTSTTTQDGVSHGYGISLVSRDYPLAAGLIPVGGRMFDERDRNGSPNVVILNVTAAKMFFPDGHAVGQQLAAGRFVVQVHCDTLADKRGRCSALPTHATVIGVVQDVARGNLETQSIAQLYQIAEQAGPSASAPSVLLVRTHGDATALAATVRGIVRQIDPEQPVSSIRFLAKELEMATSPRRFSAALILVFALVAIVLAAVGLYGLIAYQLAQRTKEFGIRLALGARGSQLLMRVLREGMMLTAVGIVLGTGLAFAFARLLKGFLYGVQLHDPVSFVVAPALLTAVAALASYLPARRAARVDPIQALRDE